jgi:hypothetical protein
VQPVPRRPVGGAATFRWCEQGGGGRARLKHCGRAGGGMLPVARPTDRVAKFDYQFTEPDAGVDLLCLGDHGASLHASGAFVQCHFPSLFIDRIDECWT